MSASERETEVKFYVRRLADLPPRILTAGGRLISDRTHERNLRFDTRDRDLQREGRLLRLRQAQQVHLTYKDGGQIKQGVWSRREIEIVVSDFNTTRELLQALGYEIVFIYEKYRTTYEMGKTEVVLDELPYGDFVEIEGGFEELKPIAATLRLNWAAAISTNYHGLFENWHTVADLPFRDLTFENLHGFSPGPEDLGVEPADT